MLLDPGNSGLQLVASGFSCLQIQEHAENHAANVLELDTFTNLVLAFLQQPERNSASRAVFGSAS